MPEATSHSIRDLRDLFEALRLAAIDAITALDAPDGQTSQAFAEANERALLVAREIAAVQDVEEQ